MVTGGHTALNDACNDPALHPIVASLLSAGALTDVPGAMDSPLTLAIQTNSIESLKLIIAAGADPNGEGYKIKPIYSATVSNNITAAKLLLEAKADLSSDHGFDCSLHRAVDVGYPEMVKFYLSVGANVNQRTLGNDSSCLHTLVTRCVGGKWTREKVTIDFSPSVADKLNKIPIDYPGVFKILVDAKANLSTRGPDGITPLLLASMWSNVEAVKALLAAGADPNDGDDSGDTPLIMAVYNSGNLDVVKALIAGGADVNSVDNHGVNVMLTAVLTKDTRLISALIDAGAEVNSGYHETGRTALDAALTMQLSDVCALLIKAGGKTKEQMGDHRPLVQAISLGMVGLVDVVIDSADKDEKSAALVAAVHKNMLSMVRRMLAAGADPAMTQPDSISALTLASIMGYADVVRELIDAGADIAFKDKTGRTPIQHAAKEKHRDVVALLLAKANELKKANK
jgi:ankyrin repeat protein